MLNLLLLRGALKVLSRRSTLMWDDAADSPSDGAPSVTVRCGARQLGLHAVKQRQVCFSPFGY